jgi:hypothetical protein
MLWDLSASDIAAIISTLANILLWVTTWYTLRVLSRQVNHQVAASYTAAQYQIANMHRDLFFGILNNPPLLARFAEANGLDPDVWELEKLSAFLVNQVAVGYLNFSAQIISPQHFEGFLRDAREIFAYPSVRMHWSKVRALHPASFRHFVETSLLWNEA